MPPKDRPPLRVVTLSEHELRELAIEWTAEGYRRAAADFIPILKRYDGPEHKAILTVPEAARVAKKKPSTIRRWINMDGGLKATQQEGTRGYRIRLTDLQDFLATPAGQEPD